eukprot:217333-Pyramimonas_sp.AAC.1
MREFRARRSQGGNFHLRRRLPIHCREIISKGFVLIAEDDSCAWCLPDPRGRRVDAPLYGVRVPAKQGLPGGARVEGAGFPPQVAGDPGDVGPTLPPFFWRPG